MAIQKTLAHKGLTAKDAYIQVRTFKVKPAFEAEKVEGVKKYDVGFNVYIYTDSTKEDMLEEKNYKVANVDESLCNYSNTYLYLKSLDEYSGAIDV